MRIERTMQTLGYALYAIAGLASFVDTDISAPHHMAWLGAYALFGLALHVGASVPSGAAYRKRRLGALAVMCPAMFAMAALMPCNFGALTLVIVASQAALVLAPRMAALLVAAQTVVISFCLIPTFGWLLGGAEIIALLGFQGFAVATIASARSESEARIALARADADLLAARDEATRARERTRIARDLHDVLGHDLTALGLQLEIASHVGKDAARVQVAKARELTSRLLEDVRSVVASMHADPSPSPALVTALRALVVEVPGLAIHLDVPESLIVEESRRAECVVRCVQEIVTNTRRHARGAENVWIRLRREDDDITVEAHDDGKPAENNVRDGHGLRGMRSRLEELGGWLEVRTASERAFVISARLPLGSLVGAE